MLKFYRFSKNACDGHMGMKHLLGGKGANLAEMAKMGLPVPAGFTIPTVVGNEWRNLSGAQRDDFMADIMAEVMEQIEWVRAEQGGPVLLSVRSGAPMSMPGMMDTILNVGITSETMAHWGETIGQRAAADSYRRLIQMLGHTAYGVDMEAFEALLDIARDTDGVQLDSELSLETMVSLCGEFLEMFETAAEIPFPDTLEEQLEAAITAVFDSWGNERAKIYRAKMGIAEDVGTAVNIQSMVFGNMNNKSGTGVLFSRNPLTGVCDMFGEFLINAQGEDVVAGIRTPEPVLAMKSDAYGDVWGKVYHELLDLCVKLELHYKDMMDIEFTVQDGELYVLQCRVGKRSAIAAIEIATDFHETHIIDSEEVFKRVTKEQFKMASRPTIDPNFKVEPTATGLGAGPGVGKGKFYTSSKALLAAPEGPKILVAKETTPDDLEAMLASVGVLTSTGGATSHAAVVARGFDIPCVVGCTELDVDEHMGTIVIGSLHFHQGSDLTLDGGSGRFWVSTEVPVIEAKNDGAMRYIRSLALEVTEQLHLIAPDEPVCTSEVVVHYTDVPNIDLAALQKETSRVIIDFNEATTEKWVEALEELFSDPDAPKQVTACEIIEKLKDLSKFIILGECPLGYAFQFKEQGAKISGPARSMADYMAMEAPEIDDKFLETMFAGNKALFKEFEGIMAKGGMKKTIMSVKPAGHPDFAVFSLLAN